MNRTKVGLGLLALLALVQIAGTGSTGLRIALEDRSDPSPRQMAIGLTVAGAALEFAISWTDR